MCWNCGTSPPWPISSSAWPCAAKRAGGCITIWITPNGTTGTSAGTPSSLRKAGIMTGEKILLADDELPLLGVLTEFLEGQGYLVRAVPDGNQALAALQAEEFTVALLDLKLPGLSGLELLEYLKARSPETEVILFTGHAGLESAVQALRLGAYDYLLKSDLLLADLQAVINRALERRRLAQTNRNLLEDLRHAQEELARRRASELTQIRRIGEPLAGA